MRNETEQSPAEEHLRAAIDDAQVTRFGRLGHGKSMIRGIAERQRASGHHAVVDLVYPGPGADAE